MVLALLRSADIPIAAAIYAVMSGDPHEPWAALRSFLWPTEHTAPTESLPKSGRGLMRIKALAAVLFSLPTSLGLACSWVLAELGSEDAALFRPGDSALLITAAAAATLCRAFRCACGAFLLRRVGVDNSWGGLFFVGGFSGFFGSMLVLPLTLGHLPLKPDWDVYSEPVQLDFSVVAVAALCLGAAETLSRLAVLRHSDTVTAASLDAGILPLAAVTARSVGIASRDRYMLAEFLALAALLLSFFIQLRSSHIRRAYQSGDAMSSSNPVLLGRAGMGEVQIGSREGPRKLRQV